MTLMDEYFNYYDYLYQHACRLTERTHNFEALDVMQELWIRIKKTKNKNITSYKASLYKMLHDIFIWLTREFDCVINHKNNRRLDTQVKYGKTFKSVADDILKYKKVDNTSENDLYIKEVSQSFRNQAKQLSPLQQSIIELLLEDMELFEIARHLNKNKKTIYTTWERMKERLWLKKKWF